MKLTKEERKAKQKREKQELRRLEKQQEQKKLQEWFDSDKKKPKMKLIRKTELQQ